MIPFLSMTCRIARRWAALWCVGFAVAGLPLSPSAAALAAPAPRAIQPCPDPEALMTSPKLAEQVWAERLDHEALCLYVASSAIAGTDAAKATDLYVLAKLRSRLDFLRCETWPHGPTSSAMAALRMTAEGQLVQAGVKNVQPQLIAAARLDETYDYVPEDPGQMCDGGPLKSAKAWKAERDGMQAEAEAMSKTQAP